MRKAIYVTILAAAATQGLVLLLALTGVRTPLPILYFGISAPFATPISLLCIILISLHSIKKFRNRQEFTPESFRGWIFSSAATALLIHLLGIFMGLALPFGANAGIKISIWLLLPIRIYLYLIVIYCELSYLFGKSTRSMST